MSPKDCNSPRFAYSAAGLASVLLLGACASSRPEPAPEIAFTKLPPFGEGSSGILLDVQGSARGAQPGQRVVLYARSGIWWVQPLAVAPFTPVQSDLTWKSKTHPGTAYAALLVGEGYHPRPTTEALPQKGGAVLASAVAEAPALARPPGKTLMFGGYEWQVRETPGIAGGTNNRYDPDNVWTDARGSLHLRIAGGAGHWTSAAVSLRRSLGYGSYRFALRNVSQLEPSAVFTMSALNDDGPGGEMDIEISQWGETNIKDAQFVIQPYFVPANSWRFRSPAGPATFLLRWAPGRASFLAYRGTAPRAGSALAGEHVFTSSVPAPGGDSIHMNLYVFGNTGEPLKHGAEVIVDQFEYLP